MWNMLFHTELYIFSCVILQNCGCLL
uniref:Uncharacterized protein n=1 Tax=Arundo donax TaxID=35708 RepID=A0A0A9HVA7_ARUDO